MEMIILGKSVADGSPPPPPPTEKVLIESKMMQCVRCGAFVAMLIYADDAKTPDRLEDYARLMYPNYELLKDEPAHMGHWCVFRKYAAFACLHFEDWPEREPGQCLRPDEFNPKLDRTQESHCA